MMRAMKFRMEPGKEQKELFEKTFGCCRFVYNRMLSDRKEAEKSGKKIRPRPAMYKKEYPWLKEADSLALCNAQLHLEAAFRNYYERPEMGYPRYRSKHRSRQSYTTNVVNGNIRIEGKRIRLPKIGMVRIRQHRKIPDGWKLKSVTVSREPSGKYYVSLLYEVPEGENQARGKAEETRYLGIDYSMNGLAVLSDGTRADYPKYYRKAQEKLSREQRRLSHCKKGSCNYRKQKRKVAKDNGYGMLRSMLEYKLEEHGGELVKVDRWFPSSKRCSCCGKIKAGLALSERTYVCSCGNVLDRDVNAAINIKLEAMRLRVS